MKGAITACGLLCAIPVGSQPSWSSSLGFVLPPDPSPARPHPSPCFPHPPISAAPHPHPSGDSQGEEPERESFLLLSLQRLAPISAVFQVFQGLILHQLPLTPLWGPDKITQTPRRAPEQRLGLRREHH